MAVKEKEESHWNHGWDQLKEERQKWSSSELPELEREHLDSGLELSQEYESDIEGFELSPSPCTGDRVFVSDGSVNPRAEEEGGVACVTAMPALADPESVIDWNSEGSNTARSLGCPTQNYHYDINEVMSVEEEGELCEEPGLSLSSSLVPETSHPS